MLVGVDYGTTRSVVAVVDRGNYPVVSFHNESGDAQEWYPSLVAARSGELRFGSEAVAVQDDPSWVVLRSLKRSLGTLAPDAEIAVGDYRTTPLNLLTAFLAQLRRDLVGRSNLTVKPREAIEAMIAVPANSNSNQRFITLEAFRRAGFRVRGMINEPSAAAIEYAHRFLNSGRGRERVAVYDLGGGTFDAAVGDISDKRHEVLSSEGIARLGGDDFDRLLLELALEKAEPLELKPQGLSRLLEECREKKEGLHPNTRKVAIDFGVAVEGKEEVIVSLPVFYERCQPMVERTLEVLERTISGDANGSVDQKSLAAVYLVGGSSDLPVVARLLRERYGRLVRKSPYPHASAAIGLAIAADGDAGYQLRERFTRHFGVWREAEGGREVSFDLLFEKGTLLPENGEVPLARERRYHPAHNVGHYRYLECSQLSSTGEPGGDVMPWDEVFVPFDPELQQGADLRKIAVARKEQGKAEVEERYSCNRQGIIVVEIINHSDGRHHSFRLRKAT